MHRAPQRLRIKLDPLVDDPAWYDTQTHPNAWDAVVAGAPSAGDWDISVDPESPSIASILNRFPAVGEDNATVADELRQLLAADLAPGQPLETFLAAVVDDNAGTITATVASTLVDSPQTGYRVTTAAPGGGSITISPNDVFPITAIVPDGFNRAKFTFRMIDGGGVQLPNNATFVDVSVVTVGRGRISFGGEVNIIGRYPPPPPGLRLSDHHPQAVVPGEEVTLGLSQLSNPPAGLAAVEVWVAWEQA